LLYTSWFDEGEFLPSRLIVPDSLRFQVFSGNCAVPWLAAMFTGAPAVFAS